MKQRKNKEKEQKQRMLETNETNRSKIFTPSDPEPPKQKESQTLHCGHIIPHHRAATKTGSTGDTGTSCQIQQRVSQQQTEPADSFHLKASKADGRRHAAACGGQETGSYRRQRKQR